MSRRVRRTAEDARRVILDAAEKRLREGGPEAVRLQDVARDVGVSHPAILHHFGSREGMLDALALRVVGRLEAELLEALPTVPGERGAAVAMERVFRSLSESGFARLLAWRLLARPDLGGAGGASIVGPLVDAVHARRAEHAHSLGAAEPTRADTLHVVRLAALVALGEGLFGGLLDHALGEPGGHDFRAWFGALLGGTPDPGAPGSPD